MSKPNPLHQTARVGNPNGLKTVVKADIAKEPKELKYGFISQLKDSLPKGEVQTGQIAMTLGKSGAGKTNFILHEASQMAKDGHRVLFISLEQPRDQLFLRLVSQELDITSEEALELLINNSPKLQNVSTNDNLMIIDAPETKITAKRIEKIIKGMSQKPDAIFIDHLGIMQSDNPIHNKTYWNEAGPVMQELAKLAKTANVFIHILQNLPKEVPAGQEFSYDAGRRGSSKQTDYCDYIYCLWRPDQDYDLSTKEREKLAKELKVKLAKNRYGMTSEVVNLKLSDKSPKIIIQK